MPSPSVFQILTANPYGLAVIRLTFSKSPKIVDGKATNDALNFANYTINGPEQLTVFDVLPVDGNPLQVDLLLSNTLVIGNWTISAINIVSSNLQENIYTGTVNFTVTQVFVQEALSPGANNDSPQNIIRKFFHPALKGPGWDSVLAALANGEEINANNTQLAFNQLYLSTASGIYLQRRAAENGQTNPVNVGLTDELFRKLATTTKTRALSQEAILEILEVFYGVDATKASITSISSEPYILKDGDELDILIDEKTLYKIPFARKHFANIGSATAEEVASEITRTLAILGSQAYAIVNNGKVQIYSASRGLSSSVRIVGGRAQLALNFPSQIYTNSFTSVTWNVSLSPNATGTLRFTETAGTYFDLSKLHVGDMVYIYGSEFATCNCNGTFKVTNINVSYSGPTLIQWFEIANPLGVAASSITQSSQLDLNFYRPTRYTIYSYPRHVIVSNNGTVLNVDIPATTQAVNREPGTAAYLNVRPAINISSLVRDTTGLVKVTTSANHGLISGNQILVENVIPSGTGSAITNGTPSGAFSGNTASGTTNASIQTTASLSSTVAAYNHQVVRLPAGQLMVVGGQTQTDPAHIVNLTNPIIFEVTASSVLANGGRQDSYTWTKLATDTYTILSRAFGCSVLKDGTILATGGTNGDDLTGTATNHWDLISYSHSATGISSGTMPAALATHAQCSRTNGNALVAGGWTTAGVGLKTGYIYTAGTQAWTATANMNLARMYAKMVEMPNDPNLALIIGGLVSTNTPTNTCEIYNTTGNVWTKTGPMSFARYKFGMVVLPDGRILVAGGVGYNPTQPPLTPTTLNSCEIFDPRTKLWSNIGNMSVGRINPSLLYIPNLNQVWIISGDSTTIDILELKTMRMRASITKLPNAYTGLVANYANNNTIAIVGGLNGTATIAADYIIVPGSESQRSGGLNGLFTINSVPSANQLTYYSNTYSKYDRFVSATTGDIIPCGAISAPKGIPGPFTYDMKNGLSVAPSVSGKLNQIINKDNFYSSIELDTGITATPAFNFPNEIGYLVINYGFDNQVGPIKYLGWFDETSLRIDPGFKFPKQIDIGATVYLLSSRGVFEPPSDKLIGNFYATGSAAGRIAAEDNVNKILAGGTDVKINILYPNDKGLGHEGFPVTGPTPLSDIVQVFGGDNEYQALLDAQASPA